jgi:hypothetical protein
MGGIPIILKTGWLLHVHILGQKTMEESIADINLTETPSARHGKRENQPHRSWFDNWAKGITIVNAMPLSETPSNESSLMFINRTIRAMLSLKNPLAANNIDAGRTRNQDPCPGVMKGSNLLSHGSAPRSLTECITM